MANDSCCLFLLSLLLLLLVLLLPSSSPSLYAFSVFQERVGHGIYKIRHSLCQRAAQDLIEETNIGNKFTVRPYDRSLGKEVVLELELEE